MAIGENIKRIRKEKGLTQKALGERCKINEVQIRQYELGKANPKIETIQRISNALNVSVLDILNFEFSHKDKEKMKEIIKRKRYVKNGS